MRATSPLAVIGLTAFLVFGAVTTPAHAAQVTTTFDGVTYTADDTNISAGATATDYNPASGPAVTIPSTVTMGGTDYTVTTIGNGAFFDNFLTSVTLPNTLTTIGGYAFATNFLTSVALPNTLTTIGNGAFFGNSLTTVTLPSTVITIGDFAFAFASNPLTSVKFLGAVPASFGFGVFTSGPVVSYYWRYGAPQTTGGFTTPSWRGYTTEAIAILTYDTNGGTAIDPAEIVVGETATAPVAPTKTDYTFDGWYTALTGGTAWNFTTDNVTGDMTLFARYTAVPATPTGTVLAATGVALPAIPAGIGAVLLLAGIALLTRRRRA